MNRGPDPYDALLLVSFGGPEQPEDVVPFLRNVTSGRDIPEERLTEVGEHYFGFGGRSPINDQNRALVAALQADFAVSGLDLPVYWGNRNWDPFLREAVEQMRVDGITRAAAFMTSAYSSYSGCRQYRENLAAAVREVPGAPRIDRLRAYFNHPGFVEPFVDACLTALAELPSSARRNAHLVFVTHSIPLSMNGSSGPVGGAYVRQHHQAVSAVTERVTARAGQAHPSSLVYCSRSGPPQVPWLEPDVNDHLRELAAAGTTGVVVVPIGFVSDHMEVVYDLDTEARATAEELGLDFARAATPGVDPRFVAMVRDLVLERAGAESGVRPDRRAVVGEAAWDVCAAGCCANPLRELPALGGRD